MNYQAAYARLFVLIMQGMAFCEEAARIRRVMDRLPGSDAQKTGWGMEIGTALYQQVIGA